VTDFEAYRTYIALRLHFTSEYDYIKYNGKCNATMTSFRKRRDMFFFKKLGRLYNKQQLEHFFIANFLVDEKVWVREMLTPECEEVYKQWQKKSESLMYFFKNDCNTIATFIDSDIKFDKMFSAKDGQHPPILKMALASKISIESFIILNSILRFVPKWDKQILDTVVWPAFSAKCKKYRPFTDFNVTKAKVILKKCLDI
jgi:hypothetical protein